MTGAVHEAGRTDVFVATQERLGRKIKTISRLATHVKTMLGPGPRLDDELLFARPREGQRLYERTERLNPTVIGGESILVNHDRLVMTPLGNLLRESEGVYLPSQRGQAIVVQPIPQDQRSHEAMRILSFFPSDDLLDFAISGLQTYLDAKTAN